MRHGSLTLIASALILLLCLAAISCGGGGSPATTTTASQQGVQFLTPLADPSIDAGQSLSITANQSVMWSLQGGDTNPVGKLSNTSAASTTVTYTAPSTVASATGVSVVATSAADSTQSAVLGIVVNPLPTVSTIGSLSPNKSCQYDPINQIGVSNGTAGLPFPANGNPVQVSGGTGPYTWSVTSGSLPAGLTLEWAATAEPPSASSAYLFGTPSTPECSQFALTVTDGTGASAMSPTYYVVITPSALTIEVPNYLDAYTGSAYPPTAFSVTGGVPPYHSWSIFDAVNSPLPPGMKLNPVPRHSASAYISGTPNGADSATNLAPYSATLQVIDSQSPYPAYGTAQINIYQWAAPLTSPCTPAQDANGSTTVTTNSGGLSGAYAFLLRGFDSRGPVVFAGSFTADGAGNVTGGIEDVVRTSGADLAVPLTGGTYSILQQSNSSGANFFTQSGCLLLTTGSGTSTFAISLGGCSTSADPNTGACVNNSAGTEGIYTTGRMIEFDDNTGSGTRVSGIVRLQNSSAFSPGLSGPYAFGLSGWDVSGNRYAAVGSFTANSATLSSIAADINDGGVLQSALTGGSGSFTAGSNGRGTATLNLGTDSINIVFYVVSGQEALLAASAVPSAGTPLVSGEAITATGPFSTYSLQHSHLFHLAGLSPSGPDVSIGILSFDGVQSFTGTQYEDQAGVVTTSSLSANYNVNANSGRVAFAPVQQLGDHPLVAYVIPVPSTLTRQDCVNLASCVTGFLISTDSSAQAGQLEFQTPASAPPPPFSNPYFSGYYFFGTDETLDNSTALVEGAAQANPNGARYAGIQSASYPNSTYCMQPACALLIPNETLALPGSYSVNKGGSGTIGGETIAVTNGNVTYYIDESPLNTHPSVIVIEQ